MKAGFCFLVAVFYFAAVLLATVHLRASNDRISYKICRYTVEQNWLKQRLWQKQLEVEKLINPAAVSRTVTAQRDGG